MANITGKNQLSPQGYGDKKAQQDLVREAPISGAPATASALNAPRRGQKRVVRGQPQPQAQAAGPTQGPQPSPDAMRASLWNDAAVTAGASDLVKEYAARANAMLSGQPLR